MLDTNNARNSIVLIFIVAMALQFSLYVLFLIGLARNMYYALVILAIIINAFLVFPLAFPLSFPIASTKLKFALPKVRQQIKGDIQLSRIVILTVKIPQIFYLFLLASCMIFLGFFLHDLITGYVTLSMQGLPYTLPENHLFFLFFQFFMVTAMVLLHAYQSEASIGHKSGFWIKPSLPESLEEAKTYLHLSRKLLIEHPRSGIRLLRYSLQKINESFREVKLLEISELPVAEHILDVISKLHPRAFCEKLVEFINRLLSVIEKGEHGKVAIIISEFNSDKELEYARKFKAPKKAVLGILRTIGPFILAAILVLVTLFHEPLNQYLITHWPGFLSVLFLLVFVGLAFILSAKTFRHINHEGQMVFALLHKPRKS